MVTNQRGHYSYQPSAKQFDWLPGFSFDLIYTQYCLEWCGWAVGSTPNNSKNRIMSEIHTHTQCWLFRVFFIKDWTIITSLWCFKLCMHHLYGKVQSLYTCLYTCATLKPTKVNYWNKSIYQQVSLKIRNFPYFLWLEFLYIFQFWFYDINY